MKRTLAAIGLACAAPLALSACADHFVYRAGAVWYSHPYAVWYDGYYGPFYDGYWGTDGYFYFRIDFYSSFRRAAPGHFLHQRPNRERERYRFHEGSVRQPPPGTRLPNYPGGPGADNRGRGHGPG